MWGQCGVPGAQILSPRSCAFSVIHQASAKPVAPFHCTDGKTKAARTRGGGPLQVIPAGWFGKSTWLSWRHVGLPSVGEWTSAKGHSLSSSLAWGHGSLVVGDAYNWRRGKVPGQDNALYFRWVQSRQCHRARKTRPQGQKG